MSRRTIFSDEYRFEETNKETVTRRFASPVMTFTPQLSSFIAIQPVSYVPRNERVITVRYGSSPRLNESNFITSFSRADSTTNLRLQDDFDYKYTINETIRAPSPITIVRPRSKSITRITTTNSNNGLNSYTLNETIENTIRLPSPPPPPPPQPPQRSRSKSITRYNRSESRNGYKYNYEFDETVEKTVTTVPPPPPPPPRERSRSITRITTTNSNNGYDFSLNETIENTIRIPSPPPRRSRSITRYDTTTTTTTTTSRNASPVRCISRCSSRPRLDSVTYVYDNTNNNNNSVTTIVKQSNDCSSRSNSLVRSNTTTYIPVSRSVHVGSIFNGDNFGLLSKQLVKLFKNPNQFNFSFNF